jgi:hypothetical protein
MVVVESAMNAEAASLSRNSHHFPNTLDPQLLAALVRRGKENFNSNIRSCGRTTGGEDQGPIQRYIASETPLRMLYPVIPVKNDGKS